MEVSWVQKKRLDRFCMQSRVRQVSYFVFAVLPDTKFQKRPNFFFKTAKLVGRFCKVCQNNPSGNSHNYESAATS